MKRFFIYFHLVLILLSIGCARTITPSSSISYEEVERVKNSSGSNTVKGSALIRKLDGEVVTCGGLPIILMPVVQYTQDRVFAIHNHVNGGYDVSIGIIYEDEDPFFKKIIKEQICDAQGNFIFENVPDGEYYLTTSIEWRTPDRIPPSTGTLTKRLHISNGDVQDVLLTPHALDSL